MMIWWSAACPAVTTAQVIRAGGTVDDRVPVQPLGQQDGPGLIGITRAYPGGERGTDDRDDRRVRPGPRGLMARPRAGWPQAAAAAGHVKCDQGNPVPERDETLSAWPAAALVLAATL